MDGRDDHFRIWMVVVLLALAFLGKPQSLQATTIEKWLIMPGEVTASHAEFEAACKNCHAPLSDQPQDQLCLVCHVEVGQDLAGQKGYHGRLPAAQQSECASCHTDHEGRDADILALDESTFDHSLTDFVLRGSHLNVACVDCHTDGELHRQAETTCVGCHRADDPHMGQLGESCDACHSTSEWRVSDFDHDTTAFSLTGAHDSVACGACHQDSTFENVGRTCIACHAADDKHEGRNGTDCASCHSSESWSDLTFNHFIQTGFALRGGHQGIACLDCHRSDDFMDLGGSGCNSCHAANDVHEGGNGTDCASCHRVSDWSNVSFDHALQTDFLLPAGHEKLACNACHTANVHDELPRECGSCHSDDDAHLGQLGTQCESCHVANTWTGRLWFDHDITNFPLIGAHAAITCDQCHSSAAFHDAKTDCVACHSDNDSHNGALGDQCGACHNPVDWQAWQFEHDLQTGFPLTGAHSAVNCTACHVEPIQQNVSISDACGTCHRRDDPHFRRFGNNCESCHTTSSFSQIEGM